MRSWTELEQDDKTFLVVGVAALVLFALVAIDVRAQGRLEQLDQPTADWLSTHASGLTLFSRGMDFLGSIVVMAPLALLGAGYLWWRNERREAVRLSVIVLVGLASYTGFKAVFQRARPPTAVGLETGYSFPSGHVTMAAVLMMYLVWLSVRRARGKAFAIPLILAAIAWALLMAAGRMTYGVHYFTDVVGGFFLGTGVGALGVSLPALFTKATGPRTP